MNKDELCLKMIEFTNQAILYELFTTPSFGLVSPYTKGSHSDMDYMTFIDSASVINRYMYKFAKLGYSHSPIQSLYKEAVEIGIQCENEMFGKTNGVNTHKGLIFVLGTLVLSVAKSLYDRTSFHSIYENAKLLVKDKLLELTTLDKTQKELTNGEKVYIMYNILGVREEATKGFPIIKEAFKVLDIDDPDSFVQTLIYIMSQCDDTTIVNRLGLKALEQVKQEMQIVFKEGYNKERLYEIESRYIESGISPGGSADLLCGTLFLALIKREFF